MTKLIRFLAVLAVLLLPAAPAPAAAIFDGAGSVTGTTTCGTTALLFALGPNAGTVQISARGTFSAGGIQVQSSTDTDNFTSDLTLTPRMGGASITSITAAGTWVLPVAADTYLCVYGNASFSGSVNIKVRAGPASPAVGGSSGLGAPVNMPVVQSPSTTINALSQILAIPAGGLNSFALVVTTSSTPVMTLTPVVSFDGGANYSTPSGARFAGANTTRTNPATGQYAIYPGSMDGATHVGVKVTAYTSGSIIATVNGSSSLGVIGTANDVGPAVAVATSAAASPLTVQAGYPAGLSVSTVNGSLRSGMDDVLSGAAALLNSQCTLSTACTAAQAVVLPMAGLQSASFSITASSAPLLTLSADYSTDGGTNYQNGTCKFHSASIASTSLVNPTFGSTANGGLFCFGVTGGISHLRVRVSAYTSGSVTLQLRGTAQPPTVTASNNSANASATGSLVFPVLGGTLGTTNALTSGNVGLASADTNGVLYFNGKVASGSAASGENPVMVAGSDGSNVQTVGAYSNDTTAAGTGLYALPAIAKANPTAVTAGRAEANQLDAATGGEYSVSIPTTTTTGTGLTTTCITTVGASQSIKASAGNLYGFSIVNGAGAGCWIQCVNSSGAGTLGTAVIWQAPIVASATVYQAPGSLPLGSFSTGIACGFASAVSGASACGTTATAICAYYK